MLIFCPSCQRQLSVPEAATGKQVKCPACAKVFVAGDQAQREQIQAPAPQPLPAPPPEPDAFEEAPLPRRIRHDDDADFIERRDDFHARRLAGNGAVLFFITAGVTMVVALLNMIVAVSVGDLFDDPMIGQDREAFLAGMICGVCGCGGLFLTINVLLAVAGLQLRSFGIKGWVVAGIVLTFVQTLLFGIIALINAIFLVADPRLALDDWAPLKLVLASAATFLNCFVGIKVIMTLNNAAVSAEFERRNAPRRRRRRD